MRRRTPWHRLPAAAAIHVAAWFLRGAFSLFIYLYERSEQRRELRRRRRHAW